MPGLRYNRVMKSVTEVHFLSIKNLKSETFPYGNNPHLGLTIIKERLCSHLSLSWNGFKWWDGILIPSLSKTHLIVHRHALS